MIRRGLRDRLRRRVGAVLVDGFFESAARLGRLHPLARPERHGVEVIRDIPYRATGSPAHRLDVWRPRDRAGLLPCVLYLHGGGFRILSKDSHWIMGLAFARRGYVVLMPNYRLAPAHPFPAAPEDAAAAWSWLLREAPRYGGDPSRVIVAGESAGANLATVLAVSACWSRPEPYARLVYETGVVPRAVVAACGLLQVSDPDRFARRKPHLPAWLRDRIDEVHDAYLARSRAEMRDLADPLCILERAGPPDRPLPPFFAPVGTADPLLDDTRRLAEALRVRGVPGEARYYPGEAHAFHAFVARRAARRCWLDTYRFLDAHCPPVAASDCDFAKQNEPAATG
ncbi:MAG: alpha/beta hydrolase [Myxococcota bacterium]|nr:alpha/beta hydrolase [Myxococcota bacterium]